MTLLFSKRPTELPALDTSFENDFVHLPDPTKTEANLIGEARLGELLAHQLAYKSHQGKIITIAEEDGTQRQYVAKALDTGSSKIVGEVFIPADGNDSDRVIVNIRGTSSKATVHADLEPAPGELSFIRNKAGIMAQINAHVAKQAQKTGKPVELVAAGHSLGGALAQQVANEAMRYQAYNLMEDLAEANQPDLDAMAKLTSAERAFQEGMKARYPKEAGAQFHGMPSGIAERNRDGFRHVKQVKVLTYNSAGVSKPVEDFSNHVAPVLDRHGYKTKARFAMIAGDGVQTTGEGTILSDAKDAKGNGADVTVFKFHRGLEGFLQTAGEAAATGLAAGAAGAAAGSVLGIPGMVAGFLLVGGGAALGMGLRKTYDGHVSWQFTDEARTKGTKEMNSCVEVYRNNTAEGAAEVKAKLQNKTQFLQLGVVRKAQSMLHYFGEKLSSRKRQKERQVDLPVVSSPRCAG